MIGDRGMIVELGGSADTVIPGREAGPEPRTTTLAPAAYWLRPSTVECPNVVERARMRARTDVVDLGSGPASRPGMTVAAQYIESTEKDRRPSP